MKHLFWTHHSEGTNLHKDTLFRRNKHYRRTSLLEEQMEQEKKGQSCGEKKNVNWLVGGTPLPHMTWRKSTPLPPKSRQMQPGMSVPPLLKAQRSGQEAPLLMTWREGSPAGAQPYPAKRGEGLLGWRQGVLREVLPLGTQRGRFFGQSAAATSWTDWCLV